jgi:hypothetical protein
MIFMDNSFLYQKLEALFRKHSADGTTPRKLIEAGMSREFRISKDECHRLLDGMNLIQKEMEKKRLKRDTRTYSQKSTDTYQNELRAFR